MYIVYLGGTGNAGEGVEACRPWGDAASVECVVNPTPLGIDWSFIPWEILGKLLNTRARVTPPDRMNLRFLYTSFLGSVNS